MLGDFKDLDSLLSIGYPLVDIIDRTDGKVVEKDVPNTVPDQIMIQGTAKPSNASLSLQWRGGSQFPGTPRADWRIVGTKGELRITSASWALSVGHPETKVELFDKASEKVEDVEVPKDEWDELPIPAQNIARLYEAHRKGEWVPDFEWAVKRHEVLEGLWQRFDAAK